MEIRNIRAFIGLPVSPETQKRLNVITRDSLSFLSEPARLVPQKNWHITVCFLGSVTPTQIVQTTSLIEDIAKKFKKITLKINKIENFPHRDSKIIAAIIEESDTLSQLYLELQNRMQSLHLEMNDKHFKPHITLVRSPQNILGFEPICIKNFIFEMDELMLYQSVSTEVGSHYYPIKSFLLGNF